MHCYLGGKYKEHNLKIDKWGVKWNSDLDYQMFHSNRLGKGTNDPKITLKLIRLL